jgi:hypothetical protein
MKLSTSAATGWIEALRDGVQKVPRTAVATMDAYGSDADPIYLKQGLYRDVAWSVTHVVYFGPVLVSPTRPLG